MQRKLYFVAIVLICTMLVPILFGCNASENLPTEQPTETQLNTQKATEDKKPTESQTNKPTETSKETERIEYGELTEEKPVNNAVDLIGDLDVTEYDLEKFIYPSWAEDVSFAEACFVRENASGKVSPIQLLYPIVEIVSVRSADLKTLYVEGKDYIVNANGELEIPEGSSIPVLAYKDYHFPDYVSDNLATKFPSADDSGWGYIRSEIGANKPGMSEWTIAVTYKHTSDDVLTVPADKSVRFAKLIEKLEAGKNIKVVSMGDSITYGWSSSGLESVNIAPYCPSYNKMVCQYIESAYGVDVEHVNIAVSGSSSGSGDKNGLGRVDSACKMSPDLVIVAYGMNDGCYMPTSTYISNINSIVKTIEKKCPNACVVVVGTCLPNSQVGYNPGVSLLKYHLEYAEALEQADVEVWNHAAFADVTTLHVDVLSRKAYQDTSGSNSNHPNDYMHRLYAQVVLQTIFGRYVSE